MIYATGEGETDADGKTKLPVLLKIGNSFAEILYAGVAPGFQGLMQINAKLPGIFTPPGVQTVTLVVGGNASQTGVTIVLR